MTLLNMFSGVSGLLLLGVSTTSPPTDWPLEELGVLDPSILG
jgi:hypothetical protein